MIAKETAIVSHEEGIETEKQKTEMAYKLTANVIMKANSFLYLYHLLYKISISLNLSSPIQKNGHTRNRFISKAKNGCTVKEITTKVVVCEE